MERDRENKEFLPGHPFPDCLQVTNDLNHAVEDANFILLVVPSHAMRNVVSSIPKGPPEGCTVISATKGIEQGSLMRMSEILADVWKERFDPERFAVLSGPSLADEVVAA